MNTLKQSHFSFEGQQGLYRGKVRDVYSFENFLMMVVSDRISAFDVILPETIPYKGQVLNQLPAHCPAGAFSGAPKIKAMLINLYEHTFRGPNRGVIEFFGMDGDITQANIIRSFISKDNVLYSQAGAGIKINSFEKNELHGENEQLAALNKTFAESKKAVKL